MTREEFYKLTDILDFEVLGNFMHGGEASEVIAQFEEAVENSCILKEKPVSTRDKLRALSDGKQHLGWLDDAREVEEEPVSEPNEQLAETYLAIFDKKFPILPTLKGKQLADYKNFLNKCQQIFGLKEWGIRPIQSKLFEKLTLLWAAWGVEHLQGVGRQDEKEQDIPVSEELEEVIEQLAENTRKHRAETSSPFFSQTDYRRGILWFLLGALVGFLISWCAIG